MVDGDFQRVEVNTLHLGENPMVRRGTATEPPGRAGYHGGINPFIPMSTLLLIPALAAVGYSILYLVFGGGLAGAVVIFFIAKLFGK
jgi:hypothetical protein